MDALAFAPTRHADVTDADAAKQAAAEAAAALVADGMTLGLGTGSTTAFAIEAIGRRVRDEGLRVRGVPTSFAAERLAQRYGIPVVGFGDLDLDGLAPGARPLDLALDGADEVAPGLALIKGRGAAQTREKVVAAHAERFVVLADPSKCVERLGARMPVPVEVVPMAMPVVAREVRALGGAPTLREGERKDGPVVTDQGLWILDARFDGGIEDPGALATELSLLPGVLDHGLFLGLATDAFVGHPDGRVDHRTA